MSTYPQYTLQSHDVYKLTITTLDTLPLNMPGAIPSCDLLRVLVFAAASRLSVHQACQQLERAPSGPTVLGTLAGQLSDLDALEGQVNDLLARLIPKGLGKRGRPVAIDVVALPYHGSVDEAHQGEVCRSKAKGGTTHFFTYATAYAVVRGRRYTLALCRVRAKQTMDYVVRTLLARLVTLGIRMKLLLLDRGFYSGLCTARWSPRFQVLSLDNACRQNRSCAFHAIDILLIDTQWWMTRQHLLWFPQTRVKNLDFQWQAPKRRTSYMHIATDHCVG
jgi:hypothetical protein